MEFITESNSLSRQIKINDTFNEFGRTYKVDNIYYKDGILHIMAEVAMNENPTEYLNIIIDGLSEDAYIAGDTVQLEATLYINNVITNGTVTWESTDSNVAAIDGEGNVNFLSDGSVSFRAYWIEEDYSETRNIISVGNPDISYRYEIIGKPKMFCGVSRKYTLHITDNSGNEADNMSYTWNVDADFEVDQSVNGNQITLCVDDKNATDRTFMLQVIVDGIVQSELEILVRDEIYFFKKY